MMMVNSSSGQFLRISSWISVNGTVSVSYTHLKHQAGHLVHLLRARSQHNNTDAPVAAPKLLAHGNILKL